MQVVSIRDACGASTGATFTGLAAWLVGLILLPAPLAARILLVAPLVVVPRLLDTIAGHGLAFGLSIDRLSRWPALLAALPLLPAFALPHGAVAGVLTLPWLAVTWLAMMAALVHALRQLPSLLRPTHAADLAFDVALGYLAVGALFLSADRLGLRPLDFPAPIILLTAVHFHFAGFGVVVIAASVAASGGAAARVAALAVVLGMPLTAAGFTFDAPAVNVVGSLVVGVGAVLVAVSLLLRVAEGRAVHRATEGLAGIALLAGVPLGIAWAFADAAGSRFTDIDWMVRVHGSLNAGGVVLGSFVAGRDEPR